MSREPGSACRRCGSCCEQGGAAMHLQDLALLTSGRLHVSDLVTIRRGELALFPGASRPQAVQEEYLKLQGKGTSWSCRFYDAASLRCTIYMHRPQACVLLDCAHPEAVLALAGRELLTRFDCIASDDPMLKGVHEHEKECPCPDLLLVAGRVQESGQRTDLLAELLRSVLLDLTLRERAVDHFRLSIDLEMFYFGRPLFQVLAPIGFTMSRGAGGMRLDWFEK